MKIWQNSKSLLRMSIETRTSRLVKKNWSRKISMDCPFKILKIFLYFIVQAVWPVGSFSQLFHTA